MTVGEFPPHSWSSHSWWRLSVALGFPSDEAVFLCLIRKREEEEKELQEKNVHRNVTEATHLGLVELVPPGAGSRLEADHVYSGWISSGFN